MSTVAGTKGPHGPGLKPFPVPVTSRKRIQKRHKSKINGKAHQNTELDPSVTTGG